MTPPEHRPPTCHACGHVALVSITQGQRVERYERCGHPSGPHPMHEFCAWLADAMLRAREEEE